MRQVSDWLLHWSVAGVEGVVSKRLARRYEPGRRGWSKFRTRIVTEAIIGGVTGSISRPETLLLGRYDRRDRLRYTNPRQLHWMGAKPPSSWECCRPLVAETRPQESPVSCMVAARSR